MRRGVITCPYVDSAAAHQQKEEVWSHGTPTLAPESLRGVMRRLRAGLHGPHDLGEVLLRGRFWGNQMRDESLTMKYSIGPNIT